MSRALVAIVALVCVTLSLLLAGAAAPKTPSTGGLIRIFAVTHGVASDDVGRPGRTAGDRQFRGLVLTDRDGTVIGSAASICTYMGATTASPLSVCTMTFVLPRGRIVAEGSRQRRDYYLLAITGGTGIYSQARGVLIASTVAVKPRSERLLFSLEP